MKRDLNVSGNSNTASYGPNRKKHLSVGLCLCLIFLSSALFAQISAPGAPGKDAQWASAGKQGVGTSATLESKVWFTLEGGAMTEVYYPDVTTANVHKLEFIVVNPKSKKVETETEDAEHTIELLKTGYYKNVSPISNIGIYKSYYSSSSLAFKQINSAKTGEWEISKTYITDPKTNSVLISVGFYTKNPDLELYVYYDPSLGNSGMHDTGWIEGRALLSADGSTASALTCGGCKFSDTTNGFLGVNDGLKQLRESGRITQTFPRAENGNLVQVAKVTPAARKIVNRSFDMLFALSFGNKPQSALLSAQNTLTKGYDKTLREYQEGWLDYLKKLPKVDPKYQAQLNMAAMELKAHEDKTHPGANIASLSVPWGGGDNANENTVGGYHLVWSRDLYQVATAYMALGDTAAANRALDFVFNVQQKPDGSFPQNSFLDGKPFWGSLQLDEVAFPLILSYQLKRFDRQTYKKHVKPAADFIVKTGPKTPQERWEEKSGYSPSTIAAEIAGLVCAADIARRNDDQTSADLYLKTADEWQANIEKWTATTNGKYGDGHYYIRLTENGTPDAKEKTVLNNGAGSFIENEIIDAGFLELVRLGIKSPDDPLIKKSLAVVDQVIKVDTPNGEAFYRYNHDGYGEMADGRRWNWDGKYTGQGRLWALLSGERGQYELALKSKDRNPQLRLDAMLGFANNGLMIPEQIWDQPETPKNIDRQFVPELKFGEGTGSATPLAWSMAQFIRLAVNLQAGRNLDTPDVVYNRYVMGKKSEMTSYDMETKVANDINGKKLTDLPKGLRFLDNHSVSQKPYRIAEDCRQDWGVRQSDTFDKIIERILKEKEAIFWQCNNDKTTVILFYKGSAKKVEIVGDFTNWKSDNLFLEDYGSSTKNDLKSIPLEFSNTARVEYKLIVDGKWITDPWNPNKIDNGVGGENSVFTMPGYQPTIWDKEDKFSITGKIEDLEITGKTYGKRTVKVYRPMVQSNEKIFFPVLYLQDGSDYINRAKAVQIQDNLVKAGKIKPFIMVFVDYKDRMKEYWASDDYAAFLAEEVVPVIDKKYDTVKTRDGRAILGASLGGVTSFHTALKYPQVFGRVGGQSPSLWIDNQRVITELSNLDGQTKYKFYIDTGTLEGVADDRRAVEILRRKGENVTYSEAEAGHNWTSWRDRLADAFIALWS